ncbi:MAG: MBL fold metallo-hydrolase [bacterium]|nr:MBL fold metallo-hydrolase [bacterium]
MKIKWLGHSTFKIGSDKTIVIDPHDPAVGTLPASLIADIVTVSHAHHDHNYIEGVGGSPKVIDKPSEYDFGGIKITGVPTFHDDVQGQERGNNIVFIYEIEGLRLGHLGDLGHLFTQEQLNLIGPIDILMIPVGGFYTIDADQAVEIVNQLKPKVVLPMHYKSKNLPASVPIAPVDEFIKKLGWGVGEVSELEINQNNISERAGSVIIFE